MDQSIKFRSREAALLNDRIQASGPPISMNSIAKEPENCMRSLKYCHLTVFYYRRGDFYAPLPYQTIETSSNGVVGSDSGGENDPELRD